MNKRKSYDDPTILEPRTEEEKEYFCLNHFPTSHTNKDIRKSLGLNVVKGVTDKSDSIFLDRVWGNIRDDTVRISMQYDFWDDSIRNELEIAKEIAKLKHFDLCKNMKLQPIEYARWLIYNRRERHHRYERQHQARIARVKAAKVMDARGLPIAEADTGATQVQAQMLQGIAQEASSQLEVGFERFSESSSGPSGIERTGSTNRRNVTSDLSRILN